VNVKRDKIAAPVSLLTIVLLFCTARFTYHQWATMEKQLGVMKQQERPWLGFGARGVVSEQNFMPSVDGRTASLIVRYYLNNFGHAPAYVFISARLQDESIKTDKIIPLTQTG
jgi:hypothetical protein